MTRSWHTSTVLFSLGTLLAVAGCDCGSGPVPEDGDVPMGDAPMGMDTPEPGGPLAPGLLATHLDMADMSGTLVFAGYSPGVPPLTLYGDLVVGTYAAGAEFPEWEIVDGVPDGPVSRDPEGWRGGVLLPGDNVGEFASVAVDGGTVNIAYYDRTNGKLKFASGAPGGPWAIHDIDQEGDAGQYASLVRTSSGLSVAYLGMLPVTTLPGRPMSEVRVASAGAAPTAPTAWTVTKVVTAEVNCRADLCPDGSVCLAAGECVMPTGGCAEECGDSMACFMGSCVETIEDDFVEDLRPFVGLHTSLAVTSGGLGLVYYDRQAGDIMGAAFDGSAWGAPFLIDGYSATPPEGMDPAGDSGLGASLAVDSTGVWHVTYADGAEEALRYATVEAGVVTSVAVVDDGSTDGADLHPDGRHIVGDDSEVRVTASGEVRVTYQDVTAQRALFARKPADGEWSVSILDAEDSNGYYTNQVIVGGTSFVGAFWRQEMRDMIGNGVRVYTVE